MQAQDPGLLHGNDRTKCVDHVHSNQSEKGGNIETRCEQKVAEGRENTLARASSLAEQHWRSVYQHQGSHAL